MRGYKRRTHRINWLRLLGGETCILIAVLAWLWAVIAILMGKRTEVGAMMGYLGIFIGLAGIISIAIGAFSGTRAGWAGWFYFAALVLLAFNIGVIHMGIKILKEQENARGSGVKAETDMKLKVGDNAPGFSLLAQDGETVSLSDFAGSKALVYFYPKADTPGCTKQACSVRDSTQELKKAGVVPLGISPDKPNEQQKFDEKYGLGFRLLSDAEHKAAEAYGVWGEKNMYGRKSMGIIRSSFLIDETGKLIGVWYNVKPEDTVPRAMEVIGE